ncbi:MAG: SxtJ family membrane protein [Gammaproteobacteria bacterium]|nr:SxtJ family membrane protein [Gammaproteobacteria bacterium]
MAALPHAIPELDRRGLREFALTTGTVVAVLFGLIIPWLLGRQIALLNWPGNWPWVLFTVLAAWGLIAPSTLRPIYRLWMRFGLVMSRITSPIMLGLVFYLVFVPAGLIMRAFGKDAMSRKFDKNAESYRVQSKKAPPEKLERPF